MKKNSIAAIFCTVLLCTSFSIFAQVVLPEQEQRIQTSYIMAFNRSASAGEVNYWKTQGNLGISQLLARHKDYIKGNPSLWDGILNVSYTDAFGRPITDDERKYHKPYPRTYFEMVNSHMDYLTKNPSLYDEVIKRSYSRALGRNANNDELKYWRGQPKTSFIWLFRAHTEWAAAQRRNNVTSTSNLTATSTSASTSGVASIAVSGSVLNEAKSAASGLVAAGGGNLIGNDGSTMVAAGGGNMVAAGGGNMVAAGGGN